MIDSKRLYLKISKNNSVRIRVIKLQIMCRLVAVIEQVNLKITLV